MVFPIRTRKKAFGGVLLIFEFTSTQQRASHVDALKMA